MDRTLSLGRAAAVAGLAIVAFAAWTLLPGDGSLAASIVSDGAATVTAVIAALACAAASRAHAVRRRSRGTPGATGRAWWLVSLGTWCWAGGELIWFGLELLGRSAPFPSVADVSYLAAVPFIFAGLVRFPGAPARTAVRIRLVLDGTILAGSLLLVSWALVLRPLLDAGAESSLALVIAVAYPMSDIVLVAVALTAFARAQRGSRTLIGLLSAGLISMALADSGFAVLALGSGYQSGHPVDALWVAAYLCLAVASRAPAVASQDDSLSIVSVVLPYPPLAIAAFVTVSVVTRTGMLDSLQTWTLAGLFGVLVLRQLVTSLDNTVLAGQLSGAMVELTAREEHFRSLVQGSSDVTAICDRDGLIRFVSPSVERIFGHRPDALLGTPVADLLHPDDLARVRAEVEATAHQDGVSVTIETRMVDGDGGWRDIETVLTNQLRNPSVRGLVYNTRDVSERRELEHQLTHQAFHDPLTGLANRSLFRDRVHHALARRHRTQHPLAVLFLDLDGFKAINDSLGHSAGDLLLRLSSERLQACVRPGDTVARLGGDEFAVLLEDVENLQTGQQVAERFLEALRSPFPLGGHDVFVNASVGLAEAAPDDDADELLRNADLAMYRAKGLGKGRCEVFEPAMHAAVVARLEIESQLRRALLDGELSLRYQPIVDLRTADLVGVEALVRWEHPQRGTVDPAEFISVAEDSGLIIPIGRWVLQQAVRQVVRWEREAGRELRLSVNLSARQLQAPRLAEHVAKILRGTGFGPERLVLEITESILVDDADRTIAKLHLLRELGVRLAIDDFGTGYSSLSYLRRLPVDVLKIDRTFIRGLGREHDVTALTAAIVSLGRQLGLEVVAEGIEDTGQLAELVAMGCDQGQGYLYAGPLQPDEFADLLDGRTVLRAAG